MFQKVLIAEDFDTNNQRLTSLLKEDLNIPNVVSSLYCDDAFLKAKKALISNIPFELLITDLSFKEDYRPQKLASGLQLIEALKKEQPELKIIVFSIEDRPSKINQILTDYPIDSFISKGRKALEELKKAITEISNGGSYFPFDLQQSLRNDNLSILALYDQMVLTYISNGYTKDKVSTILKQKDMSPSSVSSIEKRLQKLCDAFDAKNTTHLITIVKDLHLI